MRAEEFKEDLKKDKRLKADTVTSYLSIASDIEKAYELDLDDVVSDDRLMETDFAFVDTEGELITLEAVMDFVNMLGGEDALDVLEEYMKKNFN